jgi:nucleoid-associated protein YgaU
LKKSWLTAIVLMLLIGAGLVWQWADDESPPEVTNSASSGSAAPAGSANTPNAAQEKSLADMAKATAAKAAADAKAAAEKAAAKATSEAKALADKAAMEAKSAMEAAAAKAKSLGEQAGEAADAASKAAGRAIKSLMPSGGGNGKPAPSGDKSSALGDDKQKAGIVDKTAAMIAANMQVSSKANAKPDGDSANPRFDVAQIDTDGAAVIAGQALPGALIRLTDSNGKSFGQTKAEADGSFTLLSERPLPEGESALRLEATDPNGVTTHSDETIVVSRSKNAPALVVAQTDRADRPARILQQPKSLLADAKANTNAKKLAENTVSANGAIKTKDESLAVGAVDYDSKGRLTLQGTARPGAEVTIDVDGKPVAATTADKDGAWRAQAPAGTAPTDAQSRIGASTPQNTGGRALRVILPFAPASLVKDFPSGRLVVVQPGNSLWRIARRTYGEGLRYTVIYAANPSQIINPDMIFPGQILHAPVAHKG